MRFTFATLIYNQLGETKPLLANYKYMTTGDYEYLILDQGSHEPVSEFVHNYLKPANLKYIRNEENVGVVLGMQQIYESTDADLIAIFHNDVMVYEQGWNQRVIKMFEDDPKLGMVSFFGSAGCHVNGGRMQLVPPGVAAGMSNMLEAELHGMRIDSPQPIAIPDGFAMIFRREMLAKGNGFDLNYQYHHLYDRDIALESLKRGYRNMVVDVPCHHYSGLTANRPDYQNWVSQKLGVPEAGDSLAHKLNTEYFMKKWGPEGYNVLPVYINPDFTFNIQLDTRGDAITRL